jgi:hypothetical protein
MNRVRTISLAGAVLLLASAAIPAEAQLRPRTQQAATTVSRTMFMVGGARLDISDLNDRLAAAGYPVYDDGFLALGLNASRYRNGVMLGAEAGVLTRPSRTTADGAFRTTVGAGYLMFNVGYAALREGAFEVVPKVGIGGGAVSLQITDRGSPSFDEVLAQPGRSSTLATGSLLLDGSLGVTYRVGALAPAALRGLALGVRAGYTNSVLTGDWSRAMNDAPGGPDAGWGGPHVEFMIGRWTGRR